MTPPLLSYELEAVLCDQPPDRSGAVDRALYLPVGSDDETGGLQIVLLLIVESSREGRDLPGNQTVADPERQPVHLDGLERLAPVVGGRCDHLDVSLFELADIALKVQQLLSAEDSPVPPVKEQYVPSLPEILRQSYHAAADRAEFQGRKIIAGIEDRAVAA
jgi:hypothetical protein